MEATIRKKAKDIHDKHVAKQPATRAIERKLRQVEQLPHEESQKILPIDDCKEE